MPPHDRDSTDDESAESGATDRATGADDRERADPAARRRSFLKALSGPPLAAAVAGCERLDVGMGDPDVDLGDLEPGDRTGFGGTVRFADAYAVRVRVPADGTPTTVGRFDGDDRYLRVERGETTVESTIVDGAGYVVVDGECTRYPDLSAGMDSVASVSEPAGSDAPSPPELAVTERTTLDGREVVVLSLPREELAAPNRGTGSTDERRGENATAGSADGDVAGRDGELTYYVDAETGYLRRVETGDAVVDYRDWGDVDPINAPDVDCRPAE